MSWSNKYIGIPYVLNGREMDGLDCWGLVRQVYRQELRIELPSYAGRYESILDEEAFKECFNEGVGDWTPVEENDRREFDAIWLKLVGIECHCGILLGSGRMLHASPGNDSHIVDITKTGWKRRITGCYRIQ